MIRDTRAWEAFQREATRRLDKTLSYEQSLRLFEAMWRHAKEIGVLRRKNPLEGIEVDIEVARTLNSLKTPRHV